MFSALISGTLFAQKLSDKINNTSNQVDRTAKSVENATNTAGKILDLGKNLFGGKKKNKEAENVSELPKKNTDISSTNYSITIKGVDYENPYFGQIFAKVKSYKGVSTAKKALDESGGTITFDFNGDISEIWDSLEDKTKQNFKVIKVTENEMVVSSKK